MPITRPRPISIPAPILIPRLLITVIIICLSILSGHAQQACAHRWSIAVGAGPSFPIGKFAGKNFADSTQGLALTGIAINLRLQYQVNPRFGLALLLSGQRNPVDANSIARQEAEPGTDSLSVFTGAEAGPYYIGKMMLGPTLAIPLDGKKEWFLLASLMAGILRTSEPSEAIYYRYYYIPNGGIGAYGVSRASIGKTALPWSPSFLGSAGIQYKLTKWVSIQAEIDVSTAMLKTPNDYSRLDGAPFYIFSGGNGLPVVVTPTGRIPRYTLPVSSLNITAGMALRL